MKTNKTEACPVAALADEAERLVDAYAAVEDASESDEKVERYIPALSDFLDSIVDHASRERATSAKGALFQVAIASRFVEILESDALDNSSEEKIRRAIQRTLRSVAHYIESTGGIRLKDSCARHFFVPSELEDINAALALAD
ncbi:hypothetical protein [Methylocystis sp.]|uniref:hypothetical protein n=1 Tax=Methylocystis sp. TaxID=1911079 RepID=UPI003D119A86